MSTMTMTIGSSELKSRLGSYLRKVREGAVILVTDRGRPVAELRPPEVMKSAEEERLAELAAAGLMTPRTETRLKSRAPLRISGKPVSQTIIEDREDRF